MKHLNRENFDVIMNNYQDLYDAAIELLQNIYDADQDKNEYGKVYKDVQQLQDAVDEAEKYLE